MSFWAGVVQGVKDVDVLKEKEALAEERKAAAEEAKSYRDKMFEYSSARDAKADAYREREFSASETRYKTGLSREDADIARVQTAAEQARQDRLDAAADAAAAAAAANAESARRWKEEQTLRVQSGDLSQSAFDRRVSEFDTTQERLEAAAEEAARVREEERAEDLRRFELEEGRAARGEERRVEQTTIDRTMDLLKLNKKTRSAFSGEGGDVNSSDAPATAGLVEAGINFRKELGGKQGIDNMDPKSQEFFNTILQDPAATAGVYAFVQAQRSKGNDVPIGRLPSIIQIGGTMAASGKEAYDDFSERFAKNNVDMSNPQEFLAGMQALTNYEPFKVVWSQTEPVLNVNDQNAMYETFVMNTVGYGDAALSQMDRGSPEAQELLVTLNNARKAGLDNSATRTEALIKLWDMGYGREAASDLKVDAANPRMKLFFKRDNITPVAMSESPQAPQGGSVPEDTGMPSVGAPMDSPAGSSARLTFATPQEAEAAIDAMDPVELSKIPSIVIGSKVYANTEYVEEGESGMGTPALPEDGLASLVPEQQEASVLSSVVYDSEKAKGAPLSSEEELAVGIEALVSGFLGQMDPADLENLTKELYIKHGEGTVRAALALAMN
jgi:hypothetical protein